MKKLLLSAAAALMTVTMSYAQTYVTGATISDPADIQDDAVYFIHAIQPARGNAGYVKGYPDLNSQAFAHFGGTNITEISADGIADSQYLWKFKKVTEGEYAGNFKIGMAFPTNGERWFSTQGSVAVGKNKIQKVNSENDANVGIFGLETPTVQSQGDNKFWFRLNNAYPATGNNAVLATHKICMRSNNDGSLELMAYWHTDNTAEQYYVQFEIVEAFEKQETPKTVTVHLPAINGWPVADLSLELYNGQNAALTIKNKLSDMGGMANATINSDKADESDNMTVADDNTVFTVTGNWDRELIANHVYRVTMKPGDKPAAMRYEFLSGQINTIRGYNEHTSGDVENTLNRLVPERLWFFKPVEGETNQYTLHTLADPEKGVYVEDKAGVMATLSDDTHPATVFSIGKSTWNATNNNDNVVGDFYITFGASNGLNERSNYVSVWNNARGSLPGDHGSAFRLTPLYGEDMQALGLATDVEPTVENVYDAVVAFNGTDVDAALRRITYMFSSNSADLIGHCVGQYDNADGTAEKLYADALAIHNGEQEADDDTKNAIVEGLHPTNLIFKDLVPNRFYRFKNKVSGLYISSIHSATINQKAYMGLTEDNTRSNTVFLYHQEGEGDDAVNTLVCFDDGKVMPSFNGSNWIPVLKDNEDAAQGTELTYQDNGRYVIHVSSSGSAGHRHLYGAADTQKNSKIVDAANDNKDEKYQWYVEEVTELPITFYNIIDNDPAHGDDGWSSVYAPVALEVPGGTEEGHIFAYTGEFNDVDTANGDVKHVRATLIEANEDGKVIIPAGQVALLFYDGQADIENDPDFDPSAMADHSRDEITYARLPIVYDYEGPATKAGNIDGEYFAVAPEEGAEYYTLHASYNNYFRELGEYRDNYTFIPGFKARIVRTEDDGTPYYQVTTFDPNAMVPELTEEQPKHQGVQVEEGTAEGTYKVTIITSDAHAIYYKHTPAAAAEEVVAKNAPRKAPAVEGFTEADKSGNEHTFTVNGPGTVEYFAHHVADNVTGAIRSFEITDKGDAVPTGIKSVVVNMNGKQVIFDLQGRRMAAPAKGVNIINGQKTLVK